MTHDPISHTNLSHKPLAFETTSRSPTRAYTAFSHIKDNSDANFLPSKNKQPPTQKPNDSHSETDTYQTMTPD
ncbi:hypothetical protein FG476_04305 [Xylella fastidiosa subsp. multiplex]|uniref:Uncharacterized protein n=1 Tax=Xylella fastidiosa subsp. multiplex TaxID=644357 RepID=A0A9Q4QRQ8_XYLFS|nr:hypothetical protein [Xylella fastidiosa subsp. multiplex]TNV88532.1 hypothetical protein C5H23_10265 [Xylella fastidiosa]MRT45636.1 hypothetical protein [Xylella fastidiosa subsp. multiplex]MRT52821.1 hypothetical protein [Xylella fastidiosa subsp. multiplex]MRT95833.1 hypothetical protein [Xylella fastidiosa subsp. multiplex]